MIGVDPFPRAGQLQLQTFGMVILPANVSLRLHFLVINKR